MQRWEPMKVLPTRLWRSLLKMMPGWNIIKFKTTASNTNQVSTTHIRQIGKSFTHTVTISLNGGLVRNNLNVVLDAKNCEAHLYGLYFQSGQSHIDNHTIVDNIKPNCLSNELYKGILNDQCNGCFQWKNICPPAGPKNKCLSK